MKYDLESQDSSAEKEVLVVNIFRYSNIEKVERDEMLQESDKDPELQALKIISTGLPAKRSKIAEYLHTYWNFRDEFMIEGGILMKNSKVLIPETLKKKYINWIHSGHTGINFCLKKANKLVFWINYLKDKEEAVEKCRICQL